MKRIFILMGLALTFIFCLSLFNTNKVEALESVTYVDYKWDAGSQQLIESTKMITEYTLITNDTLGISNGYFVVSGSVTIEDILKTIGTVHIILLDGSSLNLPKGLGIEAENEDGWIYIYGQSKDKDVMGKLVSKGTSYHAGIGAYDRLGHYLKQMHVVINGGNIETKGGTDGAGIGACYGESMDSITINGGYVNATGGSNAAGIGGGRTFFTYNINIHGGNITTNGITFGSAGQNVSVAESRTIYITGGTIYSKGNSYEPAIGASSQTSGGTVHITGGDITAIGGKNSAAIGTGESRTDVNNYRSRLHNLIILTPVNVSNSSSDFLIGATTGSTIYNSMILEGDTVTVEGNVNLPFSYTLPEGYKLVIPKGSTLTVGKNAILDIQGELLNSGTLKCTTHFSTKVHATCTTLATCDICGIEFGEFDSTYHSGIGVEGIYQCCGDLSGAPFNSDTNQYEISNVMELIWFAREINANNIATNSNVILLTDIDLEGIVWDALGKSWDTAYQGTFDGNGHKILNLNQNNGADEGANASFVYYLGENGVIKNITFDKANVFAQGHADANASAVIVLRNKGLISKCIVSNSKVQLGRYEYLAGLVGVNESSGVIENCAVINTTIMRRFSATGGIATIANKNNGLIKNCYSYNSSDAALVVSGNDLVNSYYNSSKDFTYGSKMNEEQFASGEVAYLLNDDQSEINWYQTINEDELPSLTGKQVNYGYIDCAVDTFREFSNGMTYETKPLHSNDDGVCGACGVIITAILEANDQQYYYPTLKEAMNNASKFSEDVTISVISSSLEEIEVVSNVKLYASEDVVLMINVNNGEIYGGILNNELVNNGTILGGTLNNNITNNGIIACNNEFELNLGKNFNLTQSSTGVINCQKHHSDENYICKLCSAPLEALVNNIYFTTLGEAVNYVLDLGEEEASINVLRDVKADGKEYSLSRYITINAYDYEINMNILMNYGFINGGKLNNLFNNSGYINGSTINNVDFENIMDGILENCTVNVFFTNNGLIQNSTLNNGVLNQNRMYGGTYYKDFDNKGTLINEEEYVVTFDESVIFIFMGEIECSYHYGGFTATCSHLSICDVCKCQYGEFDDNNHDYSEVVYTWANDYLSCTALVVCLHNENHKIEETVDVNLTTVASLCEVEGSKTYEALFTNELFQTQTHVDVIDALEHSFDLETWGYFNVEGHAHLCVRGCNTYLELLPHTSSGAPTEEKDETCLECGFVINEKLQHEHKTLEEIKYDENKHWYDCYKADGYKFNEEDHKFGEGVTLKEATTTTTGEISYSCDCGYSKVEVIPMLVEVGCGGSIIGSLIGLISLFATIVYLKKKKQ